MSMIPWLTSSDRKLKFPIPQRWADFGAQQQGAQPPDLAGVSKTLDGGTLQRLPISSGSSGRLSGLLPDASAADGKMPPGLMRRLSSPSESPGRMNIILPDAGVADGSTPVPFRFSGASANGSSTVPPLRTSIFEDGGSSLRDPHQLPDGLTLTPPSRAPLPEGLLQGLNTAVNPPAELRTGFLRDLGERDRLVGGGDAISRIHNPFLRTIARIGDTAYNVAGAAMPAIGVAAALTPGTSANHQLQVGRAENRVAFDQEMAQREADQAHVRADTGLTHTNTARGLQQLSNAPRVDDDQHDLSSAQTANIRSETWLRDHPAMAPLAWHDTVAGPLLVDPRTGMANHVTVDGQPVGAPVKLTYQTAVGKDGQSHVYGVDDAGQIKVDLGHAYHPPVPGPGGEWSLEERPDGNGGVESVLMSRRTGAIKPVPGGLQPAGTAMKQNAAALKVYQPALDSAERFNIMAQNLEDAVQHGDQQAMLSLLANHIGMTAGLQKGGRITRDMYTEAQRSRPWLAGVRASFSPDGYLSGVSLTPQQMQQMVGLGRDRFQQDVSKARSQAQYSGVQGDGPKRKMSGATARFYFKAAGGDPAKATAMATADGWNVE